jgi:hypothetical protein
MEVFDEINEALENVNVDKERFSFVGIQENSTYKDIQNYLNETISDLNDIISSCVEAKTLIKQYLEGKNYNEKDN